VWSWITPGRMDEGIGWFVWSGWRVGGLGVFWEKWWWPRVEGRDLGHVERWRVGGLGVSWELWHRRPVEVWGFWRH
jgi:hypothetical protein